MLNVPQQLRRSTRKINPPEIYAYGGAYPHRICRHDIVDFGI
jgi:hypothetical protein